MKTAMEGVNLLSNMLLYRPPPYDFVVLFTSNKIRYLFCLVNKVKEKNGMAK